MTLWMRRWAALAIPAASRPAPRQPAIFLVSPSTVVPATVRRVRGIDDLHAAPGEIGGIKLVLDDHEVDREHDADPGDNESIDCEKEKEQMMNKHEID